MKLSELKKGLPASILRIEGNPELIQRLLEMGFLEGSAIQILHTGPFGGDPIAVRVRGTLVALRRSEAAAIEVLSHA